MAKSKIQLHCAKCGRSMKATQSMEGRTGKCPNCGESVRVSTATKVSDEDILGILGDATPQDPRGAFQPGAPDPGGRIRLTEDIWGTPSEAELDAVPRGSRRSEDDALEPVARSAKPANSLKLVDAAHHEPADSTDLPKAEESEKQSPKEGSTGAEPSGSVSGCLGIMGIGCLIPILGIVFLVSLIPQRNRSEDLEVEAFVMAQQFVRDSLRSPSTARFGWDPPDVWKKDDNTYVVSGHVDAQNGFGATIRNHWTCTVRHVGDDKWVCVDLKMR